MSTHTDLPAGSTAPVQAQPETITIPMNGTSMSFRDSGAGTPVVALHCSSSNGGQWKALGRHLGEGFRMMTPDFHGCGNSAQWSGTRPIRLADEAAVVAALAEHAGRPVHLIGHSFGGGVALRAALDYPQHVASLTLYEPSCFHLLHQAGSAERRLFREIFEVALAVSRGLTSGHWRQGVETFVDYWNGPGSFAALDGKRQAATLAQAPRIIMDFWALFSETAARAEYTKRLTMPVLVLEGDRSPAPSRRLVRMVFQMLVNARLKTVAGVGHMAPITHADTVNALIAEFLNSSAARKDSPTREEAA